MDGRRVRTRSRFLLAAALVAAAAIATTVAAPTDAAVGELVTLPVPARLADTREGAPTVDGVQAGTGRVPAGGTFELQVTGRAGVPADAETVVLTVTAVDAIDAGFLTVHATGTSRPNASNVNYVPGRNVANTVIARIGDSGKVSIFTFAALDLVVDVTGYFPAGGVATLLAPARLVDTREGASTIDGMQAGTGVLTPGSTLDVQVTGRAGVPAGAGVAVLTVTAVDPAAVGFLTVHATGSARPNASNVNYAPGRNVANTVVSAVGTGGRVSIFTSASSDLIVDVTGWFPNGGYTSLPAPARLADRRPGSMTIDGILAGGTGALFESGASLQLPVAGRAGVPDDASAVVLTVTAISGDENGYLTVHPSRTERPTASHVNYGVADIAANTVVARVGDGGHVCVFTSRASLQIVDVSGWFTGPVPGTANPSCPIPIHAVWPKATVGFATPEEAAADFVENGLGVPALLGEFVFGDSRSGEIDVFSPGDDDDPATRFRRGGLSLRKFGQLEGFAGPGEGWFVIFGASDDMMIDSPAARDRILPGPLTVRGTGVGHEGTIVVRAFPQGDRTNTLDFEIAAGGVFGPQPFSADLDLSSAVPGSVLTILAQGDTGLADDPGEFMAFSVVVLS